ncbi:MAG: T9SS type A sorting domain-containing protein [Saprospiraceae bacterium]|nr:T9SS type A sorting domain-containing protein [Saprospiraceae bacterium]
MNHSLKFTFPLLLFIFQSQFYGQSNPNCKLQFGTNLGGISDYATELPFVDMMKNCRTWYSKDFNNPAWDSPWNTESADSFNYRPDGYPTHVPQKIGNRTYLQRPATIWAVTDGWKSGKYIVLFDGKGVLDFWGGLSELQKVNNNKYTFNFNNPEGSILEMIINESDKNDPLHNIRIIHSDFESTYLSHPFNPLWLEKLSIFKSVRFMDWGHTNNWNQKDDWSWDNPMPYNWSDRAKIDHYTWTENKGIPYEMMIKLMNANELDGWICVPHNADDEYIRKMAEFFYDNLDPERKLTVEYSNEIWNWIFGQANWLFKYGCTNQNIIWPEGIVPYIQNCMDIWTDVFKIQPHRITRAVGVQTGWFDVSKRIINNMRPGSFDAVSPAYYFGLSDEVLETQLDALGSNATVSDLAQRVRQSRDKNEKKWISDIKSKIADPLDLPVIFYEGGQHITPNPFGQDPTYEKCLLDIQRDSSIYNLYNEWFDFLETLNTGDKPLTCMNFSFVSARSAKYGSWGILETMNQDTSSVPAPKYSAILKYIINNCNPSGSSVISEKTKHTVIYPNPASGLITIKSNGNNKTKYTILNLNGNPVLKTDKNEIDIQSIDPGIYFLQIISSDNYEIHKLVIQRN